MKNKKIKEQVAVHEIGTTAEKNIYGIWVWKLILIFLLAGAGVMTMEQTWTTLAPAVWYPAGIMILSVLCCAAGQILTCRLPLAKILVAVPWLIVLAMTRFHGYITGAKGWMEVLIARWNLWRDGDVAALTIHAGKADILAITLVITVLSTELVFWFVCRHKGICLDVYSLFWIITGLCTMTFRPIYGCAFLIGLLGLEISERNLMISRRSLYWLLLISACFGVSLLLVSDDDMASGVSFRESVLEEVHEWRYGEQTLPQGDLNQADTLKSSDEEMLKVRSEQDKNLYLRGFVGSRYQDGVWKEMPESAYNGDNAGMIKWLKNKNFDPLTQTAEYYRLGKMEDAPDINKVSVQVTGAERDYTYLAISANQVTQGKLKECDDKYFVSRGLIGTSKYSLEEISDTRPAELTVTADWLMNPENAKQKEYLEAEAVYRKFVYENYISVDKSLYPMLNVWFWSDYDSENDGIYSAVTQIRRKMQERLQYTDTPEAAPDGEDPIRYFLTKSKEGNDMLYAAAATEALRVHGIPARYVEGYYVGAEGASGNEGTLRSITGKDTHAWVEIYFDGIGWMPIDVTPGYYYDSVSLQQMVSLPDGTRKKAKLDDRSSDANQLAESNGSKKMPEKLKKVVVNTVAVILGIIGVLLILLSLLIVILEILRQGIRHRAVHIYRKASGQTRVIILESQIYNLLLLWGVDARLGWKTEETDAEIVEHFEGIKPGEYKRICKLIEKSVYGEAELEVYEERTLEKFRDKLMQTTEAHGIKTRLALRYENIILYYRIKKLERKGE